MRRLHAIVPALAAAVLLGGCGTTAAPASPATPRPSASVIATPAPTPLATATPAAATATSAPQVTPHTSDLYACTAELTPAASPAPGAPVLGQPGVDMGAGHVVVGTAVTYTSCPPTTGQHYSSQGLGPIAPRFYGPDDDVIPQGWIHNLEHGGFVILYSCVLGGCDAASLGTLRTLASTFPASPRCHIPGGALSPVIARFDQMRAPFAALVWGTVYFQQTLDTASMLSFWNTVGETTNPETYC